MSIEDCLNKVVRDVEMDESIDPSMRKTFVDAARSIIDEGQLTPEQKRAKITNTAATQQADIFHSKVAMKLMRDKEAELGRWLASQPDGTQGQALRNFVESSSDYTGHGVPSVNKVARMEENRTIAKLNDVWRAITDKRVPWARDSSLAMPVYRELAGADSGSPQAKKLAQQFREVTEPLIERANKAGVFMGRLEDFAPQSHSVANINKNLDEWRNFMRNNLDETMHPDVESTIDHLYRTLTTRHLEDPDMSTLSMSRKIHFKTPEAQAEYFNMYGDMMVSQALHHNVRTLARKVAIAEQIGPFTGPIKEQAAIIKKSATHRANEARARGDKKTAKKLESDAAAAGRVEWLVDSAAGAFQRPENVSLSQWAGGTRQWMVTQFLGQIAGLLVTQDSWISVFGTRFHTGGFGRALSSQIRNIRAVVGDANARQWAEEMGVWTHFLHTAATDRFTSPFAASEMMKGVAGQAATATQRISGTYAIERALRSATMMTISRSMARNLNHSWADIHPRYRKVLEANGFNQRYWNELRSRGKVRENLGTIELDNLPPDLQRRVMSFLQREADLAVVYPDHYDRALLTLGGQAGTFPGELAATATQFWSWPIAFLRGPLRRELAMGGAGTVGFAAGMMAAGAFSTQAYAIFKNEPTFEWDSTTLWQRAAMRSGLLTPVGEMIMANHLYDRMDIGPVGRQFDNVISTVGRGSMDVLYGEAESAARPALQMVRDLAIPNVWWTEYSMTTRAMDHAMWELDPQYMRDRDRRWRREDRRVD